MRGLALAALAACAFSSHVSDIAKKWRNGRLDAGLTAVPAWEPTWETSRSTAFMPCNDSGMFDLAAATAYGLAGKPTKAGVRIVDWLPRNLPILVLDYDWSNGKAIWANTKPMDCEELLVEQAAATKGALGFCSSPGPSADLAPTCATAYNSQTRVFVYRNFVKALPWYTFVREKISDPAYAGWFLPFGVSVRIATEWHVEHALEGWPTRPGTAPHRQRH